MNPVLFVLFAADVAGAVVGIYAMRSRLVSGKFTMINAGVMVGVALFWIFPDMTQKSGMLHSALAVGAALAALYGIDRFVYPVCPCCEHAGRHDALARGQRAYISAAGGTLIPLAAAICIHNFFDGWIAAVAGHAGSSAGGGIAIGLIAHKVPEAVVFGLMLRTATNRPNVPLLTVFVAGFAILVGGAAHSGLWMLSESTVIATSLALACSSFLFTGAHIFLRQQRHGGKRSAVAPLLVGLFISAAVEQAVSIALAESH
jgi:zinc transporter ZupT